MWEKVEGRREGEKMDEIREKKDKKERMDGGKRVKRCMLREDNGGEKRRGNKG